MQWATIFLYGIVHTHHHRNLRAIQITTAHQRLYPHTVVAQGAKYIDLAGTVQWSTIFPYIVAYSTQCTQCRPLTLTIVSRVNTHAARTQCSRLEPSTST